MKNCVGKRVRYVIAVALGLGLVLGACKPQVPPVSGGGDRTFRVPPSIDPTGRDDVTVPLQQFMASTGNDSTMVFPAGARYRVEGTLYLRGRRNVNIEAFGAQIFATSRGDGGRFHFMIEGGSNIHIRGLHVKGANPHAGMSGEAYVSELEGQHGFRAEGVNGLEFDRVTVTDVYGDFIYLGRQMFPAREQKPAVWTDGVRIHHSTFQRNGRQGITVVAGRNISIDHNSISETHRATIDLEPNNAYGGAENIGIWENKIGIGRLMFLAVGATTASIKNITADRNIFTHHSINMVVAGREGNRPQNIAITNNVTDMSADRTPMRFHHVDGVIIRNNVQPVSPNEARGPVQLVDTTNAVVEGNDWLHRCPIYVNICPPGS